MNHWPQSNNIWHGTFLGPGDSSCSNEVPGVYNGNALREHSFI